MIQIDDFGSRKFSGRHKSDFVRKNIEFHNRIEIQKTSKFDTMMNSMRKSIINMKKKTTTVQRRRRKK